jgi:hypothetical protein
MLETGIVFHTSQASRTRRRAQNFSVLALLLVICLITASCGTVQAGNGNQPQPLALSGSLPAGSVSQAYNAVLSVSGGASPYRFAVGSGVLPPGITLNQATGSFTGTPSTPGNYSFQVVVTDSPHPDQGTQSYSVTIGGTGGVHVSVSPTTANLSSGGSQLFSASVTGTPNSAVTWSASAGTISASGFYTAPTVQSTTNATVTATSQADSTQSASAAVTISAGQGKGLQISTTGLPQAQQGNSYNAVFAATGGTQPYIWSVTGGTLPTGLTLSGSGDLAGVPTTTGNFTFTVTVLDATKATASGSFSVNVSGGSGFDGPAQLPIATVPSAMSDSPTPGAVVNVNAGGDFQAALNSAQCGETIQLQAGATFGGTFTLPAKSCDANHWIIIRTSSPDSALTAEGQRMTPCYAGVASLVGRPSYNCSNPTNALSKIQIQKPGQGPIQIANGANFYRFVGLEITRANGLKGNAILISLQGTADHIILDRSWLHGNPQDETNDGFSLSGGTNIAIVDSYFNDFHCISGTGSCTDAHAVSGGISDTQDGPYKIQDNFMEASGEAIIFGGGAATMTPTDIEILNNHFWKPWQWMPGNPGFVGGPDGHPFIVKNHVELKNAVRVLVEANLMENSWGGFSQTGFGMLLSPKNQHTKSGNNVCPLCQVTDVTIRYTKISHAGGGIQLATSISGNGGNGGPGLAGERWSLHDIVMDDLSKQYVGGGGAFEITNGWPKNPMNTITINHVTAFPDPTSHLMITGNQLSNPSMYGLVFTNNLVLTGQYPVWNSGGGNTNCAYKDVPITTLNACFTSFTFMNNGLIATPQAFPPSSWPTGNMFPVNVSDVLFMNYNNGNGGNYELQSSSPYKNKGTDGKDLGADIAGLNQALTGVE